MKPSYWDAKCRHVSNCCITALWLYWKDYQVLQRRFCVTENIVDHLQNGRPRVTTAADDCYIILQHLRNRHLTAAATRRLCSIHPQTVRNRLRQNLFVHTQTLLQSNFTHCHRTARWD